MSRARIALFTVLGICAASLAAPAGGSLEPQHPHLTAAPAVVWPLDIRAVTLSQQGESFEFALRTSGTISAASIAASSGRSLCLKISRASGGVAVRRACLGLAGGNPRMILETLNPAGIAVSSKSLVRAKISRPASNRLVATIPASDLGLSLGKFRWQAATSWVDSGDCPDPGCADSQPASPTTASYTIPIPTGCLMAGRTPVSNASRSKRIVAITYDDGPSKFTRQILSLLKKNKAHATFYEIGNQMGGMASVQKQILAEGHMIGDHSWSHPVLSGGGAFASSEVSRTKSRIAKQAHFSPCTMRPPYGASSSALVRLVKAQKMTTVLWDVDTNDWRRPGAGVIASRVLSQVRPGSIILMHDGGGDRSQSVAATATILPTLKRRGYRVVSVETLLGLKLKYG